MPLLIKNGEIVTADARYRADIFCQGETITRIGVDLTGPPDAVVIDATGKLVFPGFIDPHVHIYLPFMGTFAKDTYESASRAALVGGTTTFIEMVCPSRRDEPWEAYELWKSQAAGRSACDYAFHMGITRFDESTPDIVRRIVDDGTASLKVFLAYKGAFGIDDAELFATLSLARRMGLIVTAHCENAELVAQLQQRLLAEGKTGPEWHEPSRPPAVEGEGVHHLATFAELTGAHVYVVHTSCEEALALGPTCPPTGRANVGRDGHSVPGARSIVRGAARFRGSEVRHVAAAPRTPAPTGALERAGRRRDRHGRHRSRSLRLPQAKGDGRDDFTKIPNGIPSLEDRVHLLYTHGVATGRIDLHRFVGLASTNAARLFGLFPRKGTIQPGADADLVVFDPAYRGQLSARTQSMNVDYSAFEGWPIQGRAEAVTVRGQVQVRGGKFVGTADHGRMLKREPTHST